MVSDLRTILINLLMKNGPFSWDSLLILQTTKYTKVSEDNTGPSYRMFVPCPRIVIIVLNKGVGLAENVNDVKTINNQN